MWYTGNSTPNTGNVEDDITASIANNNPSGAVSAIAKAFQSDDVEAIESSVKNVSSVGLAENAIRALVEAVNQGAINGDGALRALADPILSLPPVNRTVYSGILHLQVLHPILYINI